MPVVLQSFRESEFSNGWPSLMRSWRAPARSWRSFRELPGFPARRSLWGAFLGLILVACGSDPQIPVEPDEPAGPDPAISLHLEAVTPTSLAGVVGTPVAPAPKVVVKDQTGKPVAGIQISFSTTGGSTFGSGASLYGAMVQTGPDGTASPPDWVLDKVARSYTLFARFRDKTVEHAVAFTAVAQAGPFAALRLHSGDRQSASTGAAVALPLRVIAEDSFGNPVGGVPVSFSVVSGNGLMDSSTRHTDQSGVATSGVWTLGLTPGAQQAKAESGSLSVNFSASACDLQCQNTQLVFVRDGQIFARYGTTIRQLTVDSSGRENDPAWSPDGSRIAFVRDLTKGGEGVRSGTELYVMNADGTNIQRIAVGVHSPSWSPDGTRLAVTSNDCIYYCTLYVMDLMHPGTLVRISSDAAHPAWSPDGSKIVYVSMSNDDGYHALHVINADGSGAREVVPRKSPAMAYPSWSPDGSRIAFSWSNDMLGQNLYTVAPDGSDLRKVTNIGSVWSATWHPDGSRIAITLWMGRTVQETAIAVVDAQTGVEVTPRITPGYRPAIRPGSWQ